VTVPSACPSCGAATEETLRGVLIGSHDPNWRRCRECGWSEREVRLRGPREYTETIGGVTITYVAGDG
jgi:uncharacterized Zn finger protein